MADKKKFGLIMPKKIDTLKTRRNSIFNDESDDEENNKKRPKIPQKKISQKSSIKAEYDLDPTIYEYDSIYDDMKTKQAESSGSKKEKKSRYIDTLLKAADKRKKEYERRIDRKIQIEREKEGDEFKDKEAFVTGSYKKKLQEKEEEEERERRENMLNDMMDVTKQKDLSGFYRHFLNQTIGEEKIPSFGERHIKKEIESEEEKIPSFGERHIIKEIKKEIESDQDSNSNKVDENKNVAENLDQDSDGIEIDNEDDDSERDFSSNEKCDAKEKSFSKVTQSKDKRKMYNKQKSECNISENLEPSRSSKSDKTRIRKTSISSSDNEDDETVNKSLHLVKNKEKVKNVNKHNSNLRHDSSSSDEEQDDKSDNVKTQASETKEEKQRNIFAKRTVGDVFAEAQARYFQRMAMSNSGL